LKLNGLHGVISQKIILFITTSEKTSNPTLLEVACAEHTNEHVVETAVPLYVTLLLVSVQ
jgi:hypothetical protein